MKKVLVFIVSVLVTSVLLVVGYLWYVRDTSLTGSLGDYKSRITDLENELAGEKNKTVTPPYLNIADYASKYSSYTYLSKCDLGIYIPDNTAQFKDGQLVRTWKLNYEKVGADQSFKANPYVGGDRYRIILLSPDDASGYVPGFVSITCIKNNPNQTLEQFVDKYINDINNYNAATATALKENASNFVSKKIGKESKWGVDTYKVELKFFSIADSITESGNIFYANGNIYEIISASQSSKKPEQDSMKDIVDSITVFKK